MSTEAPAQDPRAYLRDGVDPFDSVAITIAPGVELAIRPARVSASDFLAGRASPYAVAAIRVRDAWVRAARSGEPAKVADFAGLVVDAIRDTYDAPMSVVEAWLAGADAAALHRIVAVALGAEPTRAARERSRAAALVAAGLGSAPLSPMDAAGLADWSVNAGRAPSWG